MKAFFTGSKTYYGRLKTRKEDTRTSCGSSALCILGCKSFRFSLISDFFIKSNLRELELT